MCHKTNNADKDKAPPYKNKKSTTEKERIYSDVMGSYTGRPVDGGKPVQDADDL